MTIQLHQIDENLLAWLRKRGNLTILLHDQHLLNRGKEVLCNHCNGDGVCPVCDGDEEITCPTCDGLETVTCDACDETGWKDKQAQITCEACNGNGRITCPRCGGEGTVACECLAPLIIDGEQVWFIGKCGHCRGTGKKYS